MGIRQTAYYNNEPDPYINRDPRCTHDKPSFDGICYCWSYAQAVDKGSEKEFVKEQCPKCELWKKEESK